MAKDLPDLGDRPTDISSAYKNDGMSPITDAHDGYGWVAAPVSRRIEAMLNEKVKILEAKVESLLQTQAEFDAFMKRMQFIEHKVNTLTKHETY
jgi:hypothetical protein